MKKIVIQYISGSQTLATSFELDTLSEIIAVENGVYLYFTTVYNSGPLTASRCYYGTVVYITKTGQGYDLYQQCIQAIGDVVTDPISNEGILDFTWDPGVTVIFSNMSGDSFFPNITSGFGKNIPSNAPSHR